MAAIAESDIAHYLHELFPRDMVEFLVTNKYPLLDTIRKNPDAGGDPWSVPVLTNGGQGVAGTSFATAQSSATASEGVKFAITFGSCFAVMQITEKAIRLGEKSRGAFVDSLRTEGMGVLRTKGSDLSIQLWGNGGTAFGRRASASSNIITLTNPDDVVNFFVGMTIRASANNGTDAAHSQRAGSTTVTAINRSAGTITLANAAAITEFGDDDYLFRSGQFAGDQSQGIIMKGVDAWFPASAPGGSDSFFSVNRSTDDYLSGARAPTSLQSGNTVERIRKLANFHNSRYAATPPDCWLHTRQWEIASITLQQNGYRVIERRNSTGTFGYKAIEFMTVYGDVAIMADRHCPRDHVFLMNPDHFELASLGPIMDNMDRDGLELKPLPTEAGYEKRWCTFAQPVCNNPKEFARGPLQALEVNT